MTYTDLVLYELARPSYLGEDFAGCPIGLIGPIGHIGLIGLLGPIGLIGLIRPIAPIRPTGLIPHTTLPLYSPSPLARERSYTRYNIPSGGLVNIVPVTLHR